MIASRWPRSAGHRFGLQLFRHSVGLWRWKERWIAGRNDGSQLGEANLRGVENSSANWRWPALPEYKYSDVFSAEHVFPVCRMIRKQLREDTIDLLQFHV